MVQEDIEELKRFGKEINGIQKRKVTEPQVEQHNSINNNVREYLHRIVLNAWHRGRSSYRFLKRTKNRILSRTRIESWKWRIVNRGYVKVQLRKPSAKYYTRLIETKKQIGDTTIIIRKRIHSQQPFDSNKKLFDGSMEPSMFYFNERMKNHQMIVRENQNCISLFDMPNELMKKKHAVKDRIRLFFLRF